jgi:uncharacterized membrane protein YdbT with pleckstrin-like domain
MSYVDRLLAPGETVVLRTRRHWVVLLSWVGSALVLVALGLVMASLFGLRSWELAGAGAGAWLGIVLALFGVAVAIPGWLRWANEVYLVTDRRVIQAEGVFRKQALDSSLAKVNDVRLVQTVAGRLLGYGTLEVITASDTGINRLEFLPRPLAFKKAMMGAAAETGVREGSAIAPAVGQPPAATSTAPESLGRRTAADRLAELDELRKRGLLSEEEYRSKREEILRQL